MRRFSPCKLFQKFREFSVDFANQCSGIRRLFVNTAGIQKAEKFHSEKIEQEITFGFRGPVLHCLYLQSQLLKFCHWSIRQDSGWWQPICKPIILPIENNEGIIKLILTISGTNFQKTSTGMLITVDKRSIFVAIIPIKPIASKTSLSFFVFETLEPRCYWLWPVGLWFTSKKLSYRCPTVLSMIVAREAANCFQIKVDFFRLFFPDFFNFFINFFNFLINFLLLAAFKRGWGVFTLT